MIAMDQQAAPDHRGEEGLELPALPAGQLVRGQSQPLLKAAQLVERHLVVVVECHGQGPARPVPNGLATGLLELGDEGRVALGRGQVEAEQGTLAVLHLGHRCQHPGG